MTAPRAATVAALIAAVLFVMDIADFNWGESGVVSGRVGVIACAVVVAALCFYRWSVTENRSSLTHAAAVAGLIGGAAITSSAVSGGDDAIFGSTLLAALGVAGVLAAAGCFGADRRTTA